MKLAIRTRKIPIFGELVGLWCAQTWIQIGRPEKINLVELGPGRGVLMADLIRAASAVPEFIAAASIHLVEMSPKLKEIQEQALAPFEIHVEWHEQLDAIPQGPAIFVANEFFDALPIRQYQKVGNLWRERMVTLGEADELVLQPIGNPAPEGTILEDFRDADEGSVLEDCSVGRAIASEIGTRLARDGGAALIIDYGYAPPAPGDTLQAVKDHAYHPVLESPGEADLTAHVDFLSLAQAAADAGAAPQGITLQGNFLGALGIRERADMLKADASEDQGKDIDAAVKRLVHEDDMGSLFKVLAIGDSSSPRFFGF